MDFFNETERISFGVISQVFAALLALLVSNFAQPAHAQYKLCIGIGESPLPEKDAQFYAQVCTLKDDSLFLTRAGSPNSIDADQGYLYLRSRSDDHWSFSHFYSYGNFRPDGKIEATAYFRAGNSCNSGEVYKTMICEPAILTKWCEPSADGYLHEICDRYSREEIDRMQREAEARNRAEQRRIAEEQLKARQAEERERQRLAAIARAERDTRLAEAGSLVDSIRALSGRDQPSKITSEVSGKEAANSLVSQIRAVNSETKENKETKMESAVVSFAVCAQSLSEGWICDGPIQKLLANETRLSEALSLAGCAQAQRIDELRDDQFKLGCGFVFKCENPQTEADRDIIAIWELDQSYEKIPPTKSSQQCNAFGDRNQSAGVSIGPGRIRRGTGYYGFAIPRNGPDRERELNAQVGSFLRLGSQAMSFSGLCEELNMSCKTVIDWEGNYHSCDANGRDGSRLAFCEGFPRYTAGNYGFKVSSAQDRERELQQQVGSFKRVDTEAGSFDGLCKSIGLKCAGVTDWQGASKSCQANGRDGSRIANCIESIR